jgi:hypothetical protein
MGSWSEPCTFWPCPDLLLLCLPPGPPPRELTRVFFAFPPLDMMTLNSCHDDIVFMSMTLTS